MSLLRALVGEGMDALLPEQCLVCGRFGSALHELCLARLPRAEGSRCDRCWAPREGASCGRCARLPRAFEALRTPFVFEGDARRAILDAKFGGVSRLLTPLGVATSAAVPPDWRFEAVVPVPLHPSRLRRRGFNQAEVIAREVARVFNVPLEARALRRTRRGGHQAELGIEERAANVRGLYRARGSVARRVLLVDDVTTTGQTLDAATRALIEGGAERVYTLAVAREDEWRIQGSLT